MEEFEKIVIGILSKESAIREISEKSLDSLLTHSPEQVCFSLLAIIPSQTPELSALSAVLFRKFFAADTTSLPPPVLIKAKLSLLNLISTLLPLPTRKKIADILILLSSKPSFSDDFLQLSLSWLGSQENPTRLLSFYILEIAMNHSDALKYLTSNSTPILNLLWEAIQSPCHEIKSSACRATCFFLSAIDPIETHISITTLIIEATKELSNESIICVLPALSELIEKHPRLLTPSLDKCIGTMSSIAGGAKNSIALRSAAVEVMMVTLAKLQEISENVTYVIQETITVGMVMIGEVEYAGDLNKWAESDEDMFEVVGYGKSLITSLADFMPERVYQHLKVMINAHLNGLHWVYQHTGVVALGLIVEGCSSIAVNDFEYYINILCGFALSENPRLRYAALTSLGLICDAFSISFHQEHRHTILHCIIQNLSPTVLNKIAGQAANCMINLCKTFKNLNEVTQLAPFTEPLLQCYYSLLVHSNSNSELLSCLLKSLSVLSMKIPDFCPYSHLFLTQLRTLFSAPSICSENLKNSALKCISCIIKATRPAETASILSEMLTIKANQRSSGEFYSGIMDVIVRCVVVLRENAESVHNEVIQELIKNAKAEVELAVLDNDSASSHLVNGIVFPMRGSADLKVAISTETLENKIASCKHLSLLIRSLKLRYFPYTSATFEVMSELISFKFNPEIRKISLQCIVELIDTCEGLVREELVFKAFSEFTKILNDQSTLPKTTLSILHKVQKIVQKVGELSFLGLTLALSLSESLSALIKSLSPSSDLYEPTLQSAMDIAGSLLKSFKKHFQPCFHSCFQTLIGELLYKPSPTPSELVSSLGLCCDYVEHTGDLLETNSESILIKEFIKYSCHPEPDVRQVSVYAIGLCAVHGPNATVERYADMCIEACTQVLRIPGAFSSELIISTECAVGALGKIAIGYRPALLPLWLEYLPLGSEPEEAAATHELFLTNLPRLAHIPRAAVVLSCLKSNNLG